MNQFTVQLIYSSFNGGYKNISWWLPVLNSAILSIQCSLCCWNSPWNSSTFSHIASPISQCQIGNLPWNWHWWYLWNHHLVQELIWHRRLYFSVNWKLHFAIFMIILLHSVDNALINVSLLDDLHNFFFYFIFSHGLLSIISSTPHI